MFIMRSTNQKRLSLTILCCPEENRPENFEPKRIGKRLYLLRRPLTPSLNLLDNLRLISFNPGMKNTSQSPVYLAVDFGAGSGRVMAGWLENQQLQLEEIHRFANEGIQLNGTWHWNVGLQFKDILDGLKRAAERYGDRITSIGIDTWGVDYGLIDAAGSLLGIPVQYRDSRNDDRMNVAFSRMSKEEIYRVTGNQFMPFNTVFQLLAEQEHNPGRLAAADRILLMPDLFNFWLTGVAANEATIASTMQLVNAATGEWAWDLIERLDLPRKLFRDITPPGTVLGPLLPQVAEKTGLNSVSVVTVGSHDTASAYTGVPLSFDPHTAAGPVDGEGDIFLSSGTWSLLGTRTAEAVINDESFNLAFTNERDTTGQIRLLKNHCGMWLMQECKRIWDGEEPVSWDQLVAEAEASPPFVRFIDPDDPRFAKRGDMPARLREACAESGQAVPQTRGEISRMIYESLALTYSISIERLSHLTGKQLGTLHVVGGGCRNALLNQFTANALGRDILAGPVEATALGNILSQLVADGKLNSLHDGRELIMTSFPPQRFTPRDAQAWSEARARFRNIWDWRSADFNTL
jgi:rhamnulokinase